MENDVIKMLVAWAEKDEDIRALILEGSRASGSHVDEYSDYDINVYVKDIDKFICRNDWIYSFGEVIVYQKESFRYGDLLIPTRLVIYRDLPRIDFSFWPVSAFTSFKDDLYEPYKNRFIVLMDKDGYTPELPKATGKGFEITKPSEDEFLKNIYDFYFEACVIIKYIRRDNLWFAKSIENGAIKKFLLNTYVWLELLKTPGRKPRIDGKRLEKSADKEMIDKFARCFSGYDKVETWRSLEYMASFFNELNNEYAGLTGFIYPEEKIAGLVEYMHALYTK